MVTRTIATTGRIKLTRGSLAQTWPVFNWLEPTTSPGLAATAVP